MVYLKVFFVVRPGSQKTAIFIVFAVNFDSVGEFSTLAGFKRPSPYTSSQKKQVTLRMPFFTLF